MRRRLRSLIVLLWCFCLFPVHVSAQTLSEQSVVSLLTCTPGWPLYLHFGHSALRVQDPAFLTADSIVMPVDWTFNYGIFSFDTEHFYTKFVRGETDYMLGLQETRYFIASSNADGRDVFEQELKLSLAERQQILDALIENYKPENRIYRYNFVFDNCATRPLRLIENALPDFVVPDETLADTWRDQITYYAGRWGWGEFGINLAFGRQADQRMTLAESLFLPENLMNFMAQTGLVGESHTGTFVPRDGRFWTSPCLVISLVCLLFLVLTVIDVKRGRQTYAVDAVFFSLYTLVGLLLTFLMFFSTHPFVTENANWLLLNPLWLFPLVLCCWPKGRALLSRLSPAIVLFVLVEFILARCSGQTFHLSLLLPLTHALRLLVLYLFIPKKHA